MIYYNGKLAHMHPYGGGLIVGTARIADSVFVGPRTRVSGDVEITGDVHISGDGRIKTTKIFYVFYEDDSYLVQAYSLVAAATIVDKILGPGYYRLAEVVFPPDHIFLLE